MLGADSLDEGGFSLLEVIVAFVILSMTLAAVMQIFSGGLRNAKTSQAYLAALRQAESRLARLGIETRLVEGVTHGRTAEGLRWTQTVSQLERDGRTSLYSAEVIVELPSGNRSVRLTTQKVVQR
jgi:general secretion pathway protein I